MDMHRMRIRTCMKTSIAQDLSSSRRPLATSSLRFSPSPSPLQRAVREPLESR